MTARTCRSILALGTIWGIAGAAHATNPELHFALGDVIASEQFCGLTYDQSAIEAFIAKHVSADDMGFAGDLQAHIEVRKMDFEGMGPSTKTAYCAQISRTARFYGFTR